MESTFGALPTKDFEPVELTLGCTGLRCVNWDCGDSDFEFVVGGDKVHSVLAEFLSRKVARLRRSVLMFTHSKPRKSSMFLKVLSLV